MEDYLRKVQSRLGAEESEVPKIHAVLGGPEADVDTVASTLSLALHLSQREPVGGVCVPVLFVRRCDAVLPGETVTYLRRVKVCESLLLWREDVDLVKLHLKGKLSLTLLRDGLLDSSEYPTLESSVLRVVHRDAGGEEEEEGASSAVTTVAREILQEAAEHIGAALGEILGEALRLQSETLWIKHGHRSAQLEELMSLLDQWSDVTVGQRHDEAKLQELEQQLTKELKEFSDGEMTIAFTSLTTHVEDCHGCVGELKSFCHHHGYEGLVVVLSVSDTVHHPRQQVAVYSNNTDILNQICCELEESSSWSLSSELEAGEGSLGCLQLYHLPANTSTLSDTSLLEQEIQGLLKEFVDRRSSLLACHPSSRTSSTEGVAGSVEFSQGSSGINDMYGSDIERAEGGGGDVAAMARVMEDVEEDSGSVGVGAGGELVSPDSGMATIRSSRSSKESSVFLSDDSPIGEIIAAGGAAGGPGGLFLRNPSPLGFSSLSPPVPPERRRPRSGRNRSDNFDLFSFDPLHSSNHSLPAGGILGRGDDGGRRAESSSLSEFEELSLVDFSAANSLVGLEGGSSSDDHQQRRGDIQGNEIIDTVVPPTPVNSLVGSCPPTSCGVRFFPEDVVERISGLERKDSVSSSLSEAWDELGFDIREGVSTSDAKSWKPTEDAGTESLQDIVEGVRGKGLSEDVKDAESGGENLKSTSNHQRDVRLKPQLSLITEHIESYDNWSPISGFKEQWNPVVMADLQLTPPEEEVHGKNRPSIAVKEKSLSVSRKKELLSTLTPDTSKEEDDGVQGRKGDRQMELLDFWTYSAQKGFIKSDSGTTTSYPESLDMWNMTIRDDSLSPLTTPDNLSERSDSLCGRIPKVGGGASLESPVGFSDGGMEMWNTTIQEDSSSTVTSPEGPETGRDLGPMGSWDASNEVPEPHGSKQVEDEKATEEERCTNKALSPTPEEVGWRERSTEHDVKIVIEGVEGRIWTEETEDDDIKDVQIQQAVNQNETSENVQDQTSSWSIPAPSMVTSTSEYDNVGAGGWSLPSSPETYSGPVVDIIQLEGQSSPFIAVSKPVEPDEGHDQVQKTDSQRIGVVVPDNEQQPSQVFLFEGPGELGHMTRSGGSSIESEYDNKVVEGTGEALPDWTEQPRGYSPFVMVGGPSLNQSTSASHHLDPSEAPVTHPQTDQSLSPSFVKDNIPVPPKKFDSSQSPGNNISSPLDWTINDGPAIESQEDLQIEGTGNVEGAITDTMSLSSSSGGERDGLKCSPDSLHPGSRDDLRSNSDGDSSSGLEMEYIIVSGTVKETERERKDTFRPTERDSGRQARGTERSMETYSMLSFAATVLQSQASHRKHQEITEQSRQNQTIRDTDISLSADTQENQALFIQTTLDSPSESNSGMKHSSQSTNDKHTTGSMYSQTSDDNASQHHAVPEIIAPIQSKTNSENFQQSARPTSRNQPQVEDGNYDQQSSIMGRSVSSSLRYPSDHFLKTREEVYVHSQISMEDSDEGGQSPSAPPPCHPSLDGLQVWGGQLVGQDIPQATPEPQSPVLTNSSLSHSSSLTGTPVSESGQSIERRLGLPFSGDLMEEEDDGEEQEEEASLEQPALPSWTSGVDREKREVDHIQRPQPKRDRFPQNTAEYYEEQPIRVLSRDELSAHQQTGGHEVSQENQSPIGWSPTTANGNSSPSSLTRPHDATSRASSQPGSVGALYQWTASQNETEAQTQYGYNYHHIDQRTENQSEHQVCTDTKGSSQQSTADVYAEFRTEHTAARYGSEQTGDDNETGVNADYPQQYKTNVQCDAEDLRNYEAEEMFQYIAKGPYGSNSSTNHASELHHPQYNATGGEGQYETEYVHCQFDEPSFFQPHIHHESEDHAQYVPEGYVHFLLSRPSEQEDSAAGMMMMVKMASNEHGADEMDNREDPPSSLDLSGGSNQRKKLAAPPMNVLLDRSEGSLLSDDALDTGDEALDTGDDLDINIDDLDTPDEADSLEFNRDVGGSNQGAGAGTDDAIPEYSAAEERRDSRLWRSVVIGEQEHRIDMKSIEPYQRVISHGGYYGEQNAIIVFAACFLPDSDCDNYHYVMENLFLYVISTLELMVAEDYMIVYLNGATPRRRMPGFGWMKKCYQMIDRRLKKNLKSFIIVHPSWFIRTVLGITRPFISSKFSSKIKYVNSLAELRGIIPMEYVHIPPSIIKYEEERGIHKFACLRLDKELQEETTANVDKRGNSAV